MLQARRQLPVEAAAQPAAAAAAASASGVSVSPTESLKAPGELSLGTTIMSCEFDGGVVVGADSRTTSGAYIANRVTNKLTVLHDRIFVCRSGSAADTQAIADYVAVYLKLHAQESGEAPLVHTAAKIGQQLCYDYKDQFLAGLIVAGVDEQLGGQVYTIPLGGMIVRQPFSIGGSGSSYIYGYCDAHFKKGFTRDECVQFVTNAVSLAMSRDGSSGGVVRLAIITKDGVERRMVPGNQLPTFWQE